MRAVLGIDTSCYTTSVAAVSLQDGSILQRRQLLSVEGAPGLRQSDALFQHVKNLPLLLEELFSGRELSVCAVAASDRPRPVEGSYMPVFLAGAGQARALSAALGIPCYAFSHQQGHIAAGLYESGLDEEKPFVALHLSGGTTELLLCKDGGQTLVGGTNDVNAGQLIDRAGVMLGMPFPCGRELEQLALEGEPEGLVKSRVSGLRCWFSGAENQVKGLLGSIPPRRLAAEVFSCVERTVAKLILNAAQEYGLQDFLLVGGVASSRLLREKLTQRIANRRGGVRIYFGKSELSSDNAAGIALLGKKQFGREVF